MKAIWRDKVGLTIEGQMNQGQPRHWTITAGASLEDGKKIRVFVKPKGKCHLDALVDLTNNALEEIEKVHKQPTVDAWFVAVAR